jgi:sulfide:quinone oxidoreductase
LRQTITEIDPITGRMTTDAGTFDADYLVVAVGADCDFAATPGLAEVNEFYSVAGIES